MDYLEELEIESKKPTIMGFVAFLKLAYFKLIIAHKTEKSFNDMEYRHKLLNTKE